MDDFVIFRSLSLWEQKCDVGPGGEARGNVTGLHKSKVLDVGPCKVRI